MNTPTAVSLRYMATMPSLAAAVQGDGFASPEVIWTTVPGSVPPLRATFPRAHVVFHVIDYYPAFRGDTVRILERRDYQAADTIMIIGESLRSHIVNELEIASDKVHVLGQGVEIERYSEGLLEPLDLKAKRRPRAVWTGVLRKGDAGLFRRAAEVLQSMGGSLVLIGGSCRWADRLATDMPETVALLGPRLPEEVPAYLSHCDVGLMLYDRERKAVYLGQNPLKLYEYAAASLPVISTPHAEFATLVPPVEEVRGEADVARALQVLLTNAADYRSRMRPFAERHSWSKKVEEIEGRLFASRHRISA
jgi:glycosyltransferase involved in cell wall biosynthesis